MIKRLLTLGCAIAISYCSFAQALITLEGEDAAPLGGISKNGKWAFGYIQDFGAFFYSLDAKKMTLFEGSYYVGSVSDNGVMAGNEGGAASFCKDGEWKALPLPDGAEIFESSAVGISSDDRVIVGHITFDKGPRKPYIWTLQSDNTYSVETLPYEEKDFTNRAPQGTDALFCSANGDTIVGRLIDWTGFICLPAYWTKDKDSKWQYHLLGMDIVFKEGAVLPSIPDPDPVNAMAFFTAEDSVTYKKAIEDYQAGKTDENPEWYAYNYITNTDSITKYNAAATEFNAIMEIATEKTGELYQAMTPKSFDVYSLSMSANGRYLSTTCSQVDPNGGGEPLAEDDDRIFPLVFDLNTGTWISKDFVVECMVDGVTDNGDIFYATPNLESTRTSFVIPAGTNNSVEFTEWVRQKTNGKLDIRPNFLFSYEYEDWGSGKIVVVTDTLIVGDVYPSANGRILLGTFMNPADGSQMTYFVDMDAQSDIKNVAGDKAEIVVYPNPAKDVLYIDGDVENVSVTDLTGRVVYQSSSVSGSIPVASFGKGTYLVKLIADGKMITHKIVVTK